MRSYLILYLILFILCLIILFLSLALYIFSKKSIYLSKKEIDYILFTINIFAEYGDDLGIQSKEQHETLVKELNKIKEKHFNIINDDKTNKV